MKVASRWGAVGVLVVLQCVSLVLGALHAAATVDDAQSTDLVFIYIHGFGGEKSNPQFCINMQEFLTETKTAARVENYTWDSVEIEVLRGGANWRESEQRADDESLRFAAAVIDPCELAQTPYVLVGFSIGSRVVLGALAARKGQLNHLQGVYFLGSAMARDTTLSEGVLPAGMKIINYHSPLRDKVHRTAFRFMNDLPAGGEVGFDCTTTFENYAVSCTHTHKGAGVHIDYSQLAVPIAYIELFKRGALLPGLLRFNLTRRVRDGDVWWNTVLRVSAVRDGRQVPVVIEQHNMNAGYFRAVMVQEDGTRTRIARGHNLHTILTYLDVEAGAHSVHSKETHATTEGDNQ